MKVKMDIYSSIAGSPIERAAILVIMHVESFDIVFISNIIIYSIIVSSLTLTISHWEMNGKMCKLLMGYLLLILLTISYNVETFINHIVLYYILNLPMTISWFREKSHTLFFNLVWKINHLFADLLKAFCQWIPQSKHTEVEMTWPPVTWHNHMTLVY